MLAFCVCVLNFACVFFFFGSLSQFFRYAYVPFFHSLSCPLHRVFYFHFILMFTFIAFFFRSRSVHSAIFFFFNCSLFSYCWASEVSILFFLLRFIWIIVMLCDVLLCILITYIYQIKTLAHRMIFHWQCDGYWTTTTTIKKKKQNKTIHKHAWFFLFPTAANQ